MKKLLLPRKDAIILSAIEIIDELGLQSLSTKELAARQGIAESALYRHFKNKDAIILEVLAYFSKFDNAILNSAKQVPSAKAQIMYVITGFVEYYENFQAITALLFSYETLCRYNQETCEKMEEIFYNRFQAIVEKVAAGQQSGEFTTEYTPEEFADIILGTCRAVILRWRMGRYNFALKDSVLTVLNKLLTGIEQAK